MPKAPVKCAKCKRATDGPVVCAECHDRAVRVLGDEIRKLHGQVITEQAADSIVALFTQASSRRRAHPRVSHRE